jgi:hypothetical protein
MLRLFDVLATRRPLFLALVLLRSLRSRPPVGLLLAWSCGLSRRCAEASFPPVPAAYPPRGVKRASILERIPAPDRSLT